jgi:hypothetical protein
LSYLVVLAMGCGSTHAANGERGPTVAVKEVPDLCVTKGAIDAGAVVQPTMRAYAPGMGGDAAELRFTFGGDTDAVRELASGQARRQVGLKLRAQDSCNVVYVMWRLDPAPKIDVSVKANPGKSTHEECGAEGYTKVKSTLRGVSVPAPSVGKAHSLRAEIIDDELAAWVDGRLVWQGRLPAQARVLKGPAGLRSDNVKLDGLALLAPHGDSDSVAPACKRHEHDE